MEPDGLWIWAVAVEHEMVADRTATKVKLGVVSGSDLPNQGLG